MSIARARFGAVLLLGMAVFTYPTASEASAEQNNGYATGVGITEKDKQP